MLFNLHKINNFAVNSYKIPKIQTSLHNEVQGCFLLLDCKNFRQFL